MHERYGIHVFRIRSRQSQLTEAWPRCFDKRREARRLPGQDKLFQAGAAGNDRSE
ncbi:hypothetical protein AURDEDRAFT_115673 [Auricularia subglabra TFB-10046 SS5]|uniref:Uncharacterized protein n=1 Tax=Auricularia subglabra (strain TFB-10046 / SS5) TaxID=717982 RepID=J0WYF7_AURST|nr:hypothetical protein AURDEDRAFT_115673 [Auricularia subglabra TFB-10046 SS5]